MGCHDIVEAVYLHDLSDGFVAERVIGDWIDFYNTERPHSALNESPLIRFIHA